MGLWRIVITIILSSLGVLLNKGSDWVLIINILLALPGCIPGLIHVFWVQTRDQTHVHPRDVNMPHSSTIPSECLR